MKIIREKLGAHISNYTLGEISTLNDRSNMQIKIPFLDGCVSQFLAQWKKLSYFYVTKFPINRVGNFAIYKFFLL